MSEKRPITVLHVNADVEAVVHSMHFAVAYRNRFKKDVFIDLLVESMDIMKEMSLDLLSQNSIKP